MREERFPWGLGAILVLAIVGGFGFWLGSSSASPVIVPVAAPIAPAPAPVVPAPVAPVYPTYAPHGGGFPLFPLFFGLIFVVIIFKFIRHAAWSGYQRGGPWSSGGPGGGPGGAATYGQGSFGGRGSRSRHHRGHGWYGPGFDVDDSMDQPSSDTSDTSMGQQGSQTSSPATEAARPSDPTRSRRPAFWNGRDVPPMVDEMFQRWHSRMHAEASPETKGAPDAPTSQTDADDASGSLNIPPAQPTDQQN